MWNKLVTIIQKPSTKKLGLALLVSVILHGFLIGNFDASLPQIKKQGSYMEAQLELIKPVAKPQVNNAISELKPEKPFKPSPARKIAQAKPEKKPIDPPKPEPSLALQDVDAVVPDSNVATDKNGEQVDEYLIQDDQLNSINAQTKPVEIKPPIPAPEIATVEAAPQIINQEINPDTNPDELGLIINQQAYKYVETDFAVYTEINGSPQGKAKITYNLADDSAYQINSLIEPTGLAALIVSNLLQTSVGTLTKNGLQPTNYLYQYGNKVNKTYVANFDWQDRKSVV